MKRSEAITNLLQARTHTDLAALYNANMEVQVNVAQDDGNRIDGDYKGRQWHGWSNGVETWKPFRIPHNARTIPEPNDFDINYNLAAHAEGIGMTGWDWSNHLSRWVGFDFDAIIGHSESHDKKLSEIELKKIQEVVSNIPWVTVRASTGGRGLHLYIFIGVPVTTINHTEHAALARSILGLLASITGFDFKSKVDTCGGILWTWHRKMIETPSGLSLIKQGIPLTQIPTNWKDHINVVSGKSKRIVPAFVKEAEQSDDVEKMFDELMGQKSKIPLDEGHQKLIKYLHDNNLCSWWDSDLHILVTHTIHLQRAHEELGLRGIFKTSSPATDLETQNCFLSPNRRGSWSVRRYTPGVAEAPSWTQDSSGYTRCYLNREPDLHTAARVLDGVEHESGGYSFREAEIAVKVAGQLGVTIQLPNWINTRPTKIKELKDGRLLVKIKQESAYDPPNDMQGWNAEKGYWSRIFNRTTFDMKEPEIGNYDDIVRHLITETGDDCGWKLKSNNQWRTEPLVHLRVFLKSLSLKQQEVDTILGACISKPWRLVCRPFEPEVLGDRDWNRKAPQLAFVPTKNDNLNYPHWLKILNHLGRGLDEAIAKSSWAKNSGIFTGADYLKCWVASLLKEPRQPLPYLFFYGLQNTGKTIFHEALALLVTGGIVRADHALTNQQGFNAELANAIVGIVEETDLSKKDKSSYNRIKDWTTSMSLSIHPKNGTPYSVINTLHMIQCANESTACPVLPGDSRITMIYVHPLEELIPKKQLIEQLEKEAPDFLASVLAIELPPSGDRLNVPVITTMEKKSAQDAHKSVVDLFLEEECFQFPGKFVKLAELYDKFLNWVEPSEVHNWGRNKFSQKVETRFVKGRSVRDNSVCFGNISFTKPSEEELKLPKYALVDGLLQL